MDSERRFGQTASVFACPENEAFLKMVEDPMVYIRQKELEARHAVFDNPLKMKQIRQEIEALKNGGNRKTKKDKKDKKDKKSHKEKKKSKKHHHHRSSRRRSSSSDGDSSREEVSRSRSRDRKQHRHHRHRSASSESRDKPKRHSHRLRDDSRDKKTYDDNKGLGPDIALYGEKQR